MNESPACLTEKLKPGFNSYVLGKSQQPNSPQPATLETSNIHEFGHFYSNSRQYEHYEKQVDNLLDKVPPLVQVKSSESMSIRSKSSNSVISNNIQNPSDDLIFNNTTVVKKLEPYQLHKDNNTLHVYSGPRYQPEKYQIKPLGNVTSINYYFRVALEDGSIFKSYTDYDPKDAINFRHAYQVSSHNVLDIDHSSPNSLNTSSPTSESYQSKNIPEPVIPTNHYSTQNVQVGQIPSSIQLFPSSKPTSLPKRKWHKPSSPMIDKSNKRAKSQDLIDNDNLSIAADIEHQDYLQQESNYLSAEEDASIDNKIESDTNEETSIRIKDSIYDENYSEDDDDDENVETIVSIYHNEDIEEDNELDEYEDEPLKTTVKNSNSDTSKSKNKEDPSNRSVGAVKKDDGIVLPSDDLVCTICLSHDFLEEIWNKLKLPDGYLDFLEKTKHQRKPGYTGHTKNWDPRVFIKCSNCSNIVHCGCPIPPIKSYPNRYEKFVCVWCDTGNNFLFRENDLVDIKRPKKTVNYKV